MERFRYDREMAERTDALVAYTRTHRLNPQREMDRFMPLFQLQYEFNGCIYMYFFHEGFKVYRLSEDLELAKQQIDTILVKMNLGVDL
jgi:hypothetical protein